MTRINSILHPFQ